ncbi:transcriptional regulator, TetR family [Candidatus Moduliflexus flocculans]|uniref:Transcriptional regulator, TetR family n=1 Tax=Candidatus Moduliflexus flocculans TaxID=1499966 RepID=A0A081BSZ7_9BACT|nr:transcriptional regulator, TetR family [Candidatus Moduliflexus flocculans]
MSNELIESGSGTTEERILDAAMQVFAEVGFDGARVDEIARRANANKAAIYYHIGDKEAVYTVVLQRVFSGFVQRVIETVQQAQTPEEQLRLYIRTIANNLRQHPYLPTIMMREFASGAKHLPGAIVAEMTKMIGLLASILHDGEAQGIFVHVTPLLIHILLVGGHIFSNSIDLIMLKHQQVIPPQLLAAHQHFPDTFPQEIEETILRAVKKTSA